MCFDMDLVTGTRPANHDGARMIQLCVAPCHRLGGKCVQDIEFIGDGGLSPYISRHRQTMTRIVNGCDRELHIFLLVHRIWGLECLQERTSPVNDYDCESNKIPKLQLSRLCGISSGGREKLNG